MKITDENGYEITIDNLPRAISTAKQFTSYRHEDKAYQKLDERLKNYWSDIHTKLVTLHKNQKL